ncbi:MAG TPA: hypothetical protein DDZ42_17185 [Candidatus Rokubacteria bacterium]|nr:MAG: hypothetical protein A2050_03145 [Candidatus Rokubacteria bacterium GWA2_73_35]HAM58072.1 hypothetical protein [Candidatus Rokubacteria bacterium]HBH03626.1 hypothetical protein [Candidatus Rokubacteria bacterium]
MRHVQWTEAVWAVVVAGLLLASVWLGFQASKGEADPNLHGIVAFVAAVLAIGSHVRRGGGWDFLAVVAIVVGVGLGVVAQRGGAGGDLHLAVAVSAALFSSALHVATLAPGVRR